MTFSPIFGVTHKVVGETGFEPAKQRSRTLIL